MANFGNGWIDQDEAGRSILVQTGAWNPADIEQIERAGVTGLRLSWSAGWRGKDIDFLADLPWLRSIEIYSEEVHDIRIFSRLRRLEHIGLHAPYGKGMDFSALPLLRVLKTNWRPGSNSLAGCAHLKELNVTAYPYADLVPLAQLKQLKDLRITSTRMTSLHGANAFSFLVRLDLFRCRLLTSLQGIERTTSLTRLDIDQCKKFSSLSPLSALMNLEKLSFSDCGEIESLSPIAGLTKLSEVFFTGDTFIKDNRTTMLGALPELARVGFMNRKTYDCTLEQLANALAQSKTKNTIGAKQ